MSTNVSSLEPIIIDPARSIRCDLLCRLRCTYSKGDIEYVYNKKGHLYFKYIGNGSMDVYFNNSPYKLDKIFIGKRRHISYPNDPTIIGECTFIHKGRDNNLIISFFLRTSRGFCDSQDFFSQFLNVQVGQFNVDKTVKIRTSKEWSAQQVLPSNTAYYIYNDKKNKTIVFQQPVDIDPENFKKVENLCPPIKSERALGENEFLYYHPTTSTIPQSHTASAVCTKRDSVASDLDPHKDCDKQVFNDNPPEYEGIEGYETVFGSTIVSMLLLVVALCIFKLIPRAPLKSVRDVYKMIGFLLWLPIHFSYIWFGQLSTICIFFCVFIVGYIYEKYLHAKKQFSKMSGNDDDGNSDNKPVAVGESKVIAVDDVGLNAQQETAAPESAKKRVSTTPAAFNDVSGGELEDAPESAKKRVSTASAASTDASGAATPATAAADPPEWTKPPETKNPIHDTGPQANVRVGGAPEKRKAEDMFDWAAVSGVDKYPHLNESQEPDAATPSDSEQNLLSPKLAKLAEKLDRNEKRKENNRSGPEDESDSVAPATASSPPSARWVDTPDTPPPPPPPAKRTPEEQDEIDRTRLCSWIRKYETVLDDEDLEEAMNNFVYKDDEEKDEFYNMTRLYNNLKRKGPICSGRSEAWALFISRVTDGLYTQNHKYYRMTCTFITVSFVILCFIELFGSPIKFKNTDSEALGYYKFKHKGKICRNRIRTLGNGYAIDTCYRPTDLKDYIMDKETREKFQKTYLRNRRKERSAWDACTVAFSQIDPRVNMKYNWKVERINEQKNVVSVIEVKACDFYNHFFAEGIDRAPATKTIQQPIPNRIKDAVGMANKAKNIFNKLGRKKKRKKKKSRKKKKKGKKSFKKKKKGNKKRKKASCFAFNTRILMRNGNFKYIQNVKIGDELFGNSVVEGAMKFSGEDANLVVNSGIISTYDHHVLHNGVFKKSGDVPGSKKASMKTEFLYDIDTSNHRIVILNDKDERITYTDFTEVDDDTGNVYQYELDLLNHKHASAEASPPLVHAF